MPNSQQPAASTIEEQHQAILDCSDELISALGHQIVAADIGRLRMRLAGLLHANLTLEEAQLMGPIRRLPTAERPERFTELSAEAADLRARYSEHVGKWNPQSIAGDPAGYARDAVELVRSVRAHLESKRSVLSIWKQAAAGQLA